MSEKKKIEDKLARKLREIVNLEQKIKDAKVYVRALKDVLKMLGNDNSDELTESKLKTGSAAAQAKQIIEDAKMPLHIDQILEAMGKEITRDTKSSVTSSLAAYVRRGDIFIRTAPNTFGLIELGHTEREIVASAPPDGFGDIKPSVDDDIPF